MEQHPAFDLISKAREDLRLAGENLQAALRQLEIIPPPEGQNAQCRCRQRPRALLLGPSIDQWATERTVPVAGGIAGATPCFLDFSQWARSKGLNVNMTQTAFGRSMGKVFRKQRRGGKVFYFGFRFVEACRK